MFKRTLITLLLLITLAFDGRSQNYVFYDKSDGLSSTLVKYIYEDSDGMVWIATENGLNRFDGTRFVQYFHNPSNPRSIASNLVNSLFEDSKGRLWVSTHSGVQLYDPFTDSFSPLPMLDDAPSGQVSLVLERKGGELWAIGNYVSVITVEDRSNISLSRLPVDQSLRFSDYAIEDKDFNLWTAKLNRGVVKSSPDGRIESYLADGSCKLLGLCQSEEGELLAVSSTHGLLSYDPVSDSFLPLTGSADNPSVRSFLQVSPNFFLLGTDSGIRVFDRSSGNSWNYRSSDVQVDLGDYRVCYLYRDSSANLWIGAYQKGVIMISPRRNNFRYVGHKSAGEAIIGNDIVTSILRTRGGELFVGTAKNGLYTYYGDDAEDFASGGFSGYRSHVAKVLPGRIKGGVSTLYEDSNGIVWIGLYGGGIMRYNPATGSVSTIDLSRLKGDRPATVTGFAEDDNGELWIATRGTGLYSYDLINGGLRGMSSINSSIPLFLTDILYADGNLYLGSYDGACVLDRSGNNSFFFISTDNIVNCIYELHDGSIAFGCDNGLMLWTWAGGKRLIPLGASNAGGEICSILEDNDDSVWLATGGGLCRLSRDFEPAAIFYAEDGVVNGEFNKNVAWKDSDGTLWFGGFDGITYFNPREITGSMKKWTPRITELYLHNRSVTAETRSGRWQVLDTPIYKADKIELCHSDNSFTMLFATLEHNAPERLQFVCSLDDGEWHYLPRGARRMSFSGLSPGNHVFRLKARDASMESDVVELEIIIHPSPWASVPAIIVYALILLGIVSVIVYWSVRHNRAQQQLREYRQSEQLNNFKLQFFVDIYHELKTPLTLIVNPLKKLISSDSDIERQNSYRLIQHNTDRIMQLMNQLLDLRRIDTGGLKLQMQRTDLVAYLESIVDAFSALFAAKSISLGFDHDGLQSLDAWIDRDNFDKVIHNLLSNAYKFTPENGEVRLSLQTVGSGRKAAARICVSDNGIGIMPEELENIFRRFYQSKDGQKVYRGGAGVGLDLAKALVELHHGEIHAENNPSGKGALFVVTIPLSEPSRQEQAAPAEQDSSVSSLRPGFAPVPPSTPAETQARQPKTRFRLLLAEDDAELRSYMAAELSADFRVIEASNGREALDIVLSQRPDIIVSDVIMPGMTGIELCYEVKHNININHIPLILLSGKTEETDALEGLKTGADSYLPKPVSTDMLRTTALNLIESRRMLSNSFSGRQNVADRLSVPEVETPDDKLMGRIMRVLDANLGDPAFTIEMLATEVGISRVHLHRKLKELTNQTTSDFIRNTRLTRAAKILSEGKHSIGEVASLVGFENQANFATAFKKMFGVTPREYMNRDSSAGQE